MGFMIKSNVYHDSFTLSVLLVIIIKYRPRFRIIENGYFGFYDKTQCIQLLTSCLLLVMFIIFVLLSHGVSLVRCGTRLYRFLVLANFLTLIIRVFFSVLSGALKSLPALSFNALIIIVQSLLQQTACLVVNPITVGNFFPL